MIGILHGYLLEGSGSNLWTRSVVRALCALGEDVQLVCQESRPEDYDFVARAVRHAPDGTTEERFARETAFPGRCVLHQPLLGDTLPVYVWDRYEEFARVVPMVELSDAEIEEYLRRNVEVTCRVVREAGVSVLLANHVVLMSVVARAVGRRCGIPYAVMPHGSAIEYAVRPDPRFRRLGGRALADAGCIFAIGGEIRARLHAVFDDLPGLGEKLRDLPLGVDTGAFRPRERARRRDAVERLTQLLAGLPRGRPSGLHPRLAACLDAEPARERWRSALAEAQDYPAKRPDADLEAGLDAVDWERARILVYVGRLIAAKGVPSLVAALPAILDREPRLVLVLVGHGPLREVMEALIAALAAGRRDWAERLLAWGEEPASGPDLSFQDVRRTLADLARCGEADAWFQRARRTLRPGRVLFTGYLTHRELAWLFPCCDVAVFPSLVAEAGPLVFLEALAAGCFPMGPHFAGMGASIDAAAGALAPEQADLMRLSPRPGELMVDIARKVPRALSVGERTRARLRAQVVERHDWLGVATRLARGLRALQAPSR